MALCVSTSANKDNGEMENHSSKLLQVHDLFLNLFLPPGARARLAYR